MDLLQVQKPLKEKYRNEPGSSWITLKASGSDTETPTDSQVSSERLDRMGLRDGGRYRIAGQGRCPGDA